ncbi:uncharacterized protein DNG_04655 [Cephalotrichum gorgonifer]|uniref:Zn(2)-C6 fungal-type domain-containing protein n=1 Tax=Cephalotrichum gorgonifer TaxID=2041049 RepID=A0AAE8SVI6_9PEZI|nr:uncharacterized protein DNG_04655 [Cephalotrichum gorgonifer]
MNNSAPPIFYTGPPLMPMRLSPPSPTPRNAAPPPSISTTQNPANPRRPSDTGMNDEGSPHSTHRRLSSTGGPDSAPDPAAARVPAMTGVAAPYVRRKRAIAACQFCRLRKTKCDNVRPVCGSCRHHQARCVYTDGSEGGGPQAGLDEAAARHGEVLERLDDIRNLLAARVAPSPDARSSGAGSEMGSHLSGFSNLARGSIDRESSGAGGGAVDTESVSDRQPSSSASPSAYLQYTKCESILKWPVLSDVMTEEDAAIDSFVFDAHVRGDGEEYEEVVRMSAAGSASPASSRDAGSGAFRQPKATQLFGRGVQEGAFVMLCQKFLALVDCRNPIMDARDLLVYARSVAEDGLGWDAKSCVVLLACALASYSRAWKPPPFIRTSPSPTVRRDSAVPPDVMAESDDEAAEAYFEAAQRRLGCLGTSLIDIQCYYYASLCERFAFRPLQAWMYLQQAATRLRVHHIERQWEENRRQTGGQDGYRVEPRCSTARHHFEQRAFWTIHKAEREFATELGISLASDLTGFKYPEAFPTPPESVNHLTAVDDDDDSDMSDVFSPRRNEFVWFFYLAEISLRRTLDEILSVIYEKGEQYWIENVDLVLRQYYESEKQMADWQFHLPPTMRYDPASQPNNEMGYYLEGRFEEWNECILRPLVYYCLHYPPTKPPTPSIVALAQRDMTLCENCILRCANHDRHGGTWVVLRRAFRCTLIMLAAVVADGPLRPPENWRELTSTSIGTFSKWSVGVRDLQRMRRVLERVFRAVCEVVATRMPVEGRGAW